MLPALVASAVGVLAFQFAPAAAQTVSSQQLAQELQFFTGPYNPPKRPGLHQNVFLVEVETVARDADGHSVGGLKQGDFRLYDDGKRQQITQFLIERAGPPAVSGEPSVPAAASGKQVPAPTAVPVARPHYVALFFDDRNSPFGDLRYAQLAGEKFVREDLRADDQVGVFTASGAVSLDFTADRQKLIQAIASLRIRPSPVPTFLTPPCAAMSGCPAYPVGPYEAYQLIGVGDRAVARLFVGLGDADLVAQTLLGAGEITAKFTLDSLEMVIARLARMPGQRVIVLLSSGFFTASLKWRIDETIQDALRAGVVVSAIDAKGLTTDLWSQSYLQNPNPRARTPSSFEEMIHREERFELDNVMADLAWDTGGTFFHNDNDLAAGLRQVAAVPEVSYRLVFAPSDLKNNGRFHNLKVKVEAKGVAQVQARRGYFAPSPAEERAEAKLWEFHAEVLGANEIVQLPAQVAAQVGLLASGGKGVQVSMRLSAKALAFRNVQGRHLDRLNFVAALLDSRGKCVAGEMGLAVMALKKETLAYLTERGIDATLVVPAPAGSYRLRVVIQDAGSGKLFATSRPVAIP